MKVKRKPKRLNKTFGTHISSIRKERRVGQLELSRIIGVSPSFLNDLEKDKLAAPELN